MIVNDALEYGFIKDKRFHAVRLNIKGRPTPTGVTHAIDPEGVRRVIWWNGGIAGEGESFFPHPEAWRLTQPDWFTSNLTSAFDAHAPLFGNRTSLRRFAGRNATLVINIASA